MVHVGAMPPGERNGTAPGGCKIHYLKPDSDSCDVVCALGLKEQARRHVKRSAAHPLTDKERAVIDMTVKGYSFKEIAEELECTLSTVQSHKQRAMEKLELENIPDLFVTAASLGWRSCPCRTFTQDSLFNTA